MTFACSSSKMHVEDCYTSLKGCKKLKKINLCVLRPALTIKKTMQVVGDRTTRFGSGVQVLI